MDWWEKRDSGSLLKPVLTMEYGMKTQQAIDYLSTLPLTEALWWFIENMADDAEGRTDVFFSLRERMRDSEQHIVVTGNPVDGLQFTGPFNSHDEAIGYAEQLSDNWWTADLAAPEA